MYVGLFLCVLSTAFTLDSHVRLRDELNQLYPPFYLSPSKNGRHASPELLASALGKAARGTGEAIRWLTLSAVSAGNASTSLAMGTFASFVLHSLHACRVLRAIDLMRSGLPLEALLTSEWPACSWTSERLMPLAL